MMYPTSLDPAVVGRAFRASNGELGIRLEDTKAFLEACRRDQAQVFGWELWIINHRWADANDGAVEQRGAWCGGVPLKAGGTAIFHGEGDADASEDQISRYDLAAEIIPDYLPLVRINFTLGD